MGDKLQKLPLSIQSFEDLRTNNYLYVDKTKEMLELINSGKSYFLSRPRRFGKSLLVSTLENLFLGNEELFEDLYIYDKWDWSESYPVIRIDLGGRTHRSGEKLKNSLSIFLTKIAKEHGIGLEYDDYDDKFGELIEELVSKYGKVVVLVDEYDKPILDNVSYPDVRDDMKEILHDFYQILKSQDDNLRFVFITGVSKFVGTSIFSGLNSPDDLTIDKEFSTICGYTQSELEYYFKPYMNNLAKEVNISMNELLIGIKEWYNGYSWDGRNFVYNPQSTLSLFRKNEFSNYWFKTGTPTFLLELLKIKTDLNKVLNKVEAGSEISDSYDPDNIPIVPLMFQSGYLTIGEKEIVELEPNYILTIPNKEVKSSLVKYLLNLCVNYPLDDISSLRNRMRRNFLNKDGGSLDDNLREMIANVPYHLHVDEEKYYHTIFLVWLNLLGFEIDGEVSTDKGRMDAVLIIDDEAFIIEIKFSGDEDKIDVLVDEALGQIKDKKYYEKYLKYDVSFLGVAFADKEVKCKFSQNLTKKK
ncbi:MAG: ATP-binding protein [Methanobrevibacter sp.]|jgi:hypothetical protein|nr:ATP-binding protein [Candidatus Methanovirga australis]